MGAFENALSELIALYRESLHALRKERDCSEALGVAVASACERAEKAEAEVERLREDAERWRALCQLLDSRPTVRVEISASQAMAQRWRGSDRSGYWETIKAVLTLEMLADSLRAEPGEEKTDGE